MEHKKPIVQIIMSDMKEFRLKYSYLLDIMPSKKKAFIVTEDLLYKTISTRYNMQVINHTIQNKLFYLSSFNSHKYKFSYVQISCAFFRSETTPRSSVLLSLYNTCRILLEKYSIAMHEN